MGWQGGMRGASLVRETDGMIVNHRRIGRHVNLVSNTKCAPERSVLSMRVNVWTLIVAAFIEIVWSHECHKINYNWIFSIKCNYPSISSIKIFNISKYRASWNLYIDILSIALIVSKMILIISSVRHKMLLENSMQPSDWLCFALNMRHEY